MGVSRRKMLAEARKLFKALLPGEYPTIVALADDLAEDDADGLFEFGLKVWLDGLARQPASRPRRAET
jgi:hypothetical protein